MFSISIKSAVPRNPEFCFREPIFWHISEGENWAIIGPNGAGKTILADILQRKIVLKKGEVEILSDEKGSSYQWIKSMAFRDIYSLADCRNMYYQQRWNSADAEEAPLAISLLKEFSEGKIQDYASLFHIDNLLEKRIISLSSGELRKFLITRVLMTEPKLLILDNPFIGLDVQSRETLSKMLMEMKHLNGLQIVLIVSNPDDLPEWVDRILPVRDKKCFLPVNREEFIRNREAYYYLFPDRSNSGIILPRTAGGNCDYKITLQMDDVHVQYGKRTILNGINWTIRKGEKWALLGDNGSGKSTLLSLVCGDNPQAYANKLVLFGRRRGTGESIWDIKKRIGYLSPDMHTYYLQDIPCQDVVASGFFDTIGLYRKCTEEQREVARQWLEILKASHLAEKSFVRISYGEQRLILLARAFVKNPELLILDEPLHGLDIGKKRLARSVIEAFCSQENRTLIYVTHYVDEIPECVKLYKTLKKG